MKPVEVWTDGSCRGNPGPAGWGVVLRCNGHEKQLFGSNPKATNQQMELTAAIRALEALKKSSYVLIYSDSAYLVNCMNQAWIEKWKQKGWRTSRKKPVANRELWETLDELTDLHEVHWVKVDGHSDNEGNNLAHALAYACSRKEAS